VARKEIIDISILKTLSFKTLEKVLFSLIRFLLKIFSLFFGFQGIAQLFYYQSSNDIDNSRH
jgi:hypothetical protein